MALIGRVEEWLDTQYGTAGWGTKLHNFIQEVAKEAQAEALQSLLKDVEKAKKKTQKETGAFKYDFVYEEITDLIQSKL